MNAIGIDFGTTNSVIAAADERGSGKVLPNAEGSDCTKTVVAFEDQEKEIVGDEAYNQALANPNDTVFEFKLKLGSPDVLYTTASDNKLTATDLAARVLVKLKRDAEQFLGEPVSKAVITVPADSRDDQKKELMAAAETAGLETLQLLPEPTAAAVAYGYNQANEQLLMVSDLGGGTFDVSILRCQEQSLKVLGTNGIEIGGRDFTQKIQEHVIDAFSKKTGIKPDKKREPAFFHDVRDRAEQAKFSLGVAEQTRITISSGGEYETIELTREQFNEMISSFIDQIVEACVALLKQCELAWEDIDNVLLVGGGNKVLRIKDAIEHEFGKPVSQDIDPMKAIAIGAAIQAAVLSADADGNVLINGRAIPAPKVSVQDVTAHSIGCVLDDPVRDCGVCAVIIPRHSPIPCEKEDLFRFKLPDQTGASVQIIQGEEGKKETDCQSIGEIKLLDLPIEQSLPKRIRVLYSIDANGMAKAYAEDLVSGKKADIEFDYSNRLRKTTSS